MLLVLANKSTCENEAQGRAVVTAELQHNTVNYGFVQWPLDDEDEGDCVAESITSVNCGSVRLPSHKKGGGTLLARTWNWAQKLKVKYWTQHLKLNVVLKT